MWLPQTYLSLNLTIPIHAVIFAKIYSRPWQEMPTNCHIDLLRGGILFPKENGSFQEDGNSFNANVSDFSLSRGGGGEATGCCLIAADPRTSWWITFFDAHSHAFDAACVPETHTHPILAFGYRAGDEERYYEFWGLMFASCHRSLIPRGRYV